jgi:hypothetical protein
LQIFDLQTFWDRCTQLSYSVRRCSLTCETSVAASRSPSSRQRRKP